MLEGLSGTVAATFGQSKTRASRRALDFRLRVGAHPARKGRVGRKPNKMIHARPSGGRLRFK
jgi:hypothetical protein